MSNIYGGPISDLFQNLLKTINKSLDKIVDLGLKAKEEAKIKEESDGTKKIKQVCYMGNEDTECEILFVITPEQAEKDTADLIIKDSNNHKMEEKNIKNNPETVNKCIIKFAEKFYDTDTFTMQNDADPKDDAAIHSSCRIILQRILGATDESIVMLGVESSDMTGDSIMNVLDNALDDSNFSSMISEVPTTFEFIDNGDNIDADVYQGEAIHMDEEYMYNDLLSILYYIWNNFLLEFSDRQILGHTDPVYDIWSMIQDLQFRCNQLCGTFLTPRQSFLDCEEMCELTNYELISIACDRINCYICQVDENLQSKMDHWLGILKCLKTYFSSMLGE